MTNTLDAPLLHTPEEAARLLRVSRATLYRLMESGELVSVRLGRSRRIRRADLEALVGGLS